MKCTILHESAGRLRVHLCCARMTLHQADVLEYYLRAQGGVRSVKVYDRTQDAVVLYDAERGSMLRALAVFSFAKAEAVAAEVGVDAVYAEVLPEDKAAFIRQEKAKGHTVIMVGDGVNDSPALSEADAGIAISTGAAIAREIADITVASENLFALVTLRRLGEALMERIHGSYRFIVGFNLTLIALGVAGVLPPATSALLHNGSTLGISLRNMTDLLDKNKS